MSNWTIAFPNSEYVSNNLTLRPLRLAHNDRGGCHEAIVEVTGPLRDTQFCTDWIGRHIKVINDVGTCVWWGVIGKVAVGVGKWGAGRSLENLINRCAVEYTIDDQNTGENYAITDWLDDATSQSEYGTREYVASIGEANPNLANARRATIITQNSSPKVIRSRTQNETTTLTCWGLIRFLEWKYYKNLVGRVENDGDSVEEMSIGWFLNGSEIGFWQGLIHDLSAGLNGLHKGDKLVVSGSVSNNGVKYVDEPIKNSEVISLTASTISFLSNDDIYDSAEGFGPFQANSFVNISGSSLNNGYHAIDSKPENGYMTTKQSFTNAIVNEPGGASITIEQGNFVTTTSATVNEKPGASGSVSITLVGFQVGQSFVAPATMVLDKVAVKVGKMGTPVDSLHIRLYSDSGGNPDTWLDTATIQVADLEQGGADWVWATWATGISVSAATTYWLLFVRSGSNDKTNYYLVDLVGVAYGSTKAWDNSTWVGLTWLPSGTVSVPFKLRDAEDTSSAIARVIMNCGGTFVTSTEIGATGVEHSQWADEGARGNHELTKLLDIGTSAGLRLTCEVNEQGTLIVVTESERPTDTLTLSKYTDDNKIIQHNGVAWQGGLSAAGKWLNLPFPPDVGNQWDISHVYVRKSEYDVTKGIWALTFGDSELLSSYQGT